MHGFLLGRRRLIDPLIALDKTVDQPDKLSWPLHLNAVPGVAHYLEPSLGQQSCVTLAGALRDDPIIVAPDNQRRDPDTAQQMRQGLTVHVGLPGNAEAHLTAEVPIDQ